MEMTLYYLTARRLTFQGVKEIESMYADERLFEVTFRDHQEQAATLEASEHELNAIVAAIQQAISNNTNSGNATEG